MTDELKNALLESNIQCIANNNGKFCFLYGTELALSSQQPLVLPSLFNREIPVGSFLLATVKDENSSLSSLVYVCCNASQRAKVHFNYNNLFWFQISGDKHDIRYE